MPHSADNAYDYHRTLLDALAPITGPLEMSQWASEEFAQLCKSTGKPVGALTIEDLTRAMHHLHASYKEINQ